MRDTGCRGELVSARYRPTHERFSRLLDAFMRRAGVGDSELARRLERPRLTVHRWRRGSTLPKPEAIASLRQALRWVDGTGRVVPLDDAELMQLQVAAGLVPDLSDAQRPDRIEPSDRCVVYSYRYARTTFPPRWSLRVIELEQTVPGSLYLMLTGLPVIARPADYYAADYYVQRYSRALVDSYREVHRRRQEAFLARLEESVVRHVYTRQEAEHYLRTGQSVQADPAEDTMGPRLHVAPREVVREHVDTILRWMERYPCFEVALTDRPVPLNVTILGHDVVLLDPTQSMALLPGANIMGLEIIGRGAAAQFTEQFDAIWADRATLTRKEDVAHWLLSHRPA